MHISRRRARPDAQGRREGLDARGARGARGGLVPSGAATVSGAVAVRAAVAALGAAVVLGATVTLGTGCDLCAADRYKDTKVRRSEAVVESKPGRLESCDDEPKPTVEVVPVRGAPLRLSVERAYPLCLNAYAALLRLENPPADATRSSAEKGDPDRGREGKPVRTVRAYLLEREWRDVRGRRPPRRERQSVAETLAPGSVRYRRIRWREGTQNPGERHLRVRLAGVIFADGTRWRAGPWPGERGASGPRGVGPRGVGPRGVGPRGVGPRGIGSEAGHAGDAGDAGDTAPRPDARPPHSLSEKINEVPRQVRRATGAVRRLRERLERSTWGKPPVRRRTSPRRAARRRGERNAPAIRPRPRPRDAS